ncbi:MAG: MDR family oxidoreductase [Pseudomonadota bacterium]
MTFKALLLTQQDNKTVAQFQRLTQSDLPPGDVLVAVEYSSLNYKDALAVTGTGAIVRQFPMVPGIDLAGTVLESASPDYQAGDKVVLTGWGVGERYWGGYSQVQRVRSEWLVPLASGLDTHRAMAIGTAGFTAMLCVTALLDDGLKPEHGPVLVTGAAGGVGSVAVALLAKLGYNVTALTAPGQEHAHGYLRQLGAASIVSGGEWLEPPRPLENQRWAAAIDSVGSQVLARALAEVRYGGAVAACGLAGGADLPTSVMPFILRGVRLLGIDSVMCPTARRKQVWSSLASHLPAQALIEITRTIALADVPRFAQEMMAGQIRGRVVVDLSK